MVFGKIKELENLHLYLLKHSVLLTEDLKFEPLEYLRELDLGFTLRVSIKIALNYTKMKCVILRKIYKEKLIMIGFNFSAKNIYRLLVFGTGNILIMGAILLTKELQNDTGILIFNLSLAELLITGFLINFCYLQGVFVGKKFFVLMSALCDFIGAICLIACVTSLMNIGFLAINRYLIICHNKLYHRLFTHKKTIVYCVINWLMGILVDLPNFTGWGGHYYDSKTISCIWNRLKSHSYSIFFPTTIMSLSRNEKKKGYGRSIKLAKGLFASFILFTACWLPYGLILKIKNFNNSEISTVYTSRMARIHEKIRFISDC
ncbi:melatonin receptor type 1B-B-like [Brachionus plicatilis]|uniref:Melatonin receptor type 1B-B-like n=1 Tax=Brachionus plicatilis TaxID=10195 RepID=A0A3M7RDM3_BRAPC|nr:melatonin receptor type 1B-B-like [Brachionus plicatilis]